MLNNSLINKIAAGEVVERPASVVKELIENAMDGGASVVTVEIEDGGSSLIRVTDNGRGIPADEAPTAILRHATSKITDISDLENLSTMGFRGEALASVAAVSRLTIITKTADASAGTRLETVAGEIVSKKAVGCADGTTVIVRDLFHNTPVRRKFLKKPSVETGYIEDMARRLALGMPHIAFRLIVSGSHAVRTSGSGLRAAIAAVYGASVSGKLVEVAAEKNGMTLTGFAGKPEIAKPSRQQENFFIAGRYIKSRLASAAVAEGYGTRLMVGRFPMFALNLTAAPGAVDINVHPGKLEARFEDEAGVAAFIAGAVEKALGGVKIVPAAVVKPKPKSESPAAELTKELTIIDINKKILSERREIETKPLQTARTLLYNETMAGGLRFREEVISREPSEIHEVIYKPAPIYPEPEPDMELEDAEGVFRDFTIVGQVFGTYWIIERGDSLYLIDQHAAHEKILYDELTASANAGKTVSQRLLAPVPLELAPPEVSALTQHREPLERFGYGFERAAWRVSVTDVPFVFGNALSPESLAEIAAALTEPGASVRGAVDYNHALIAMAACKAAIKGDSRISREEAEALITRLSRLSNPFNCPHGRPTAIELTKRDVEKMFKRIV